MRDFIDKLDAAFERVSLRFGGKNILLLALALLVAMLTIIVSDYWIVKIQKQNARIALVRSHIFEANQLKENLFRAESAQRAYLITLDEGFALPFDYAINNARKSIDSMQTTIATMLSGDALKMSLNAIQNMSSSLEAKTAEMTLTLNLVKSGKIEEAKTIVKLGDGLDEAEKLVSLSEDFINKEKQILNNLEESRKRTILLTRIAIVFGSIILISLVVIVISQQLKELSIRGELHDKLAAENERYENEIKKQRKLLYSMALDHQADSERERQKLARDLHDELGSILTAAKMDISWTMKKVSEHYPEVTEKLKKTNKYLDQGIEFKRQVVQDLHPSMIASFGFWPAIQTFTEEVAARNRWQLNLELPAGEPQLNETISLIAYRVIQESLNNASKYAKASEVSVHMLQDEKYLKIEITDNGVGTDLESLGETTHGLSGMRHRVLAIGGHFEITSKSGNGMFTHALLPLDIDKYDY